MLNRSFQIPSETTWILEMISLIQNPSFINGFLEAPLDLLVAQKAMTYTGFNLSRFDSIRSVVQTLRNTEKSKDWETERKNNYERKKEGLHGIIVQQKLPGFVSFDQAGYEDDPLSFEDLRLIIVHFIELGYRGSINFNHGHLRRDGESWDSTTNLTLCIGGTRNHPRADGHEFTLDILYDKEDDFNKPILAKCQEFPEFPTNW